MIGDGYAMCVAAEIPQYLRRAAKCRLQIHDPVLFVQPAQELGKLLGICQDGSRTGTLQLGSAVEPFEAGDELTPEDALRTSSGRRYVRGSAPNVCDPARCRRPEPRNGHEDEASALTIP